MVADNGQVIEGELFRNLAPDLFAGGLFFGNDNGRNPPVLDPPGHLRRHLVRGRPNGFGAPPAGAEEIGHNGKSSAFNMLE